MNTLIEMIKFEKTANSLFAAFDADFHELGSHPIASGSSGSERLRQHTKKALKTSRASGTPIDNYIPLSLQSKKEAEKAEKKNTEKASKHGDVGETLRRLAVA